MQLKLNPTTGKFDLIGMTASELAQFVKIAGDTMTGELTINPSTDEALTVQAGKRIVFDGA